MSLVNHDVNMNMSKILFSYVCANKQWIPFKFCDEIRLNIINRASRNSGSTSLAVYEDGARGDR